MNQGPDPPPQFIVPRQARIQSLLVVFASAAGIFALSALIKGWDWAVGITILAILTATILGKFAVLLSLAPQIEVLGMQLPSYSAYVLGALVFYLDTLVAILMAYNFDLMTRIPGIGNKILEARMRGQRFLHQYTWFKRVAYVGIVAFVFFPVSGTGAIAGSILGSMLGLSRRLLVFLIMLGGAIGGFGFAAGVAIFREDFEEIVKSSAFQIVCLVLLALLVGLVLVKVRRHLRTPREGSGLLQK